MRIMRFKSLYLYKWLPHGYRWKRIVNVSISREKKYSSRKLCCEPILTRFISGYPVPWCDSSALSFTLLMTTYWIIYFIHGLSLPKGSLSDWISSEDPWACLDKRMFQYDSRPRSTDRLSRVWDVTKKRGWTQTEIPLLEAGWNQNDRLGEQLEVHIFRHLTYLLCLNLPSPQSSIDYKIETERYVLFWLHLISSQCLKSQVRLLCHHVGTQTSQALLSNQAYYSLTSFQGTHKNWRPSRSDLISIIMDLRIRHFAVHASKICMLCTWTIGSLWDRCVYRFHAVLHILDEP